MIRINEGFICENCITKNNKTRKTCRNHCKYCFFSKHVDAKIPGDRQSSCLGIMEPISIETTTKKGYMIVHHCVQCHKQIRNKLAEDDQIETLIQIVQKHNLNLKKLSSAKND